MKCWQWSNEDISAAYLCVWVNHLYYVRFEAKILMESLSGGDGGVFSIWEVGKFGYLQEECIVEIKLGMSDKCFSTMDRAQWNFKAGQRQASSRVRNSHSAKAGKLVHIGLVAGMERAMREDVGLYWKLYNPALYFPTPLKSRCQDVCGSALAVKDQLTVNLYCSSALTTLVRLLMPLFSCGVIMKVCSAGCCGSFWIIATYSPAPAGLTNGQGWWEL